jgi:hypothetical protein
MSQGADREQAGDRMAAPTALDRWHGDGRTVEELIVSHIEPHPARPGRAEWRLKERGVPVWAVIGALVLTDNPADNQSVLSDEAVTSLLGERQVIEQVAANYDISREAVEAAIAYYWQHKPLIDARLLANAG